MSTDDENTLQHWRLLEVWKLVQQVDSVHAILSYGQRSSAQSTWYCQRKWVKQRGEKKNLNAWTENNLCPFYSLPDFFSTRCSCASVILEFCLLNRLPVLGTVWVLFECFPELCVTNIRLNKALVCGTQEWRAQQLWSLRLESPQPPPSAQHVTCPGGSVRMTCVISS